MAIRMSLAVAIVLVAVAGCQTPAGPRGKLADAAGQVRNPVKAADRDSNLQRSSSSATVAQAVPQVPAMPVSTGDGPKIEIPPISQIAAPPSSETTSGALRRLHQRSVTTYAKMDTYMLRLKRREVVGGKARPDELILAKFRKEPFSVYLKWLGEEGKGREVAFVKGRYEDQIHTLMAPGDLFLFAGKVFKVPCDSPLVKSNSRYPITEAGMGPLIDRFGRLVMALEKGEPHEGTGEYLGTKKRPEFEEPVEVVLQTLPAKSDPNLPVGGRRWWHFDAQTGLPVLVITNDEKDREVEYYCHDRFQYPANLDEDDFDPTKLWKHSDGKK